MYHFTYLSKQEVSPAKNAVIEHINRVQDDVQEHFTFQFQFVGSTKQNMVTYDEKTNLGYDFDVNLMVHDPNEDYSPEKIKHILMHSFYKTLSCTPYFFSCEDSTRVFTVKTKPYFLTIPFHCDFAIVSSFDEKNQQYIRFNKKAKIYTWEMQSKGYQKLPQKIDFCKKNKLWGEVRKIYLDKKNVNTEKNKKSRSLFAETIHLVCHQNGYL